MRKTKAVRFLLISLLLSIILSASSRAGDLLIKIGNVDETLMESYKITEGNFIMRKAVFFDGLEAAVSDISSKQPGAFIKKRVTEAGPEIKNLFPCMARIAGQQGYSEKSGWKKFILFYTDKKKDRGYYVFQINKTESDTHNSISSVAVANQQGRLEKWQISDNFPRGEKKTVYRIDQKYFYHQLSQGNFPDWIKAIVGISNGIGVLVLKKNNELSGQSDEILVWVRLNDFSGRTTVPMVIGWERE